MAQAPQGGAPRAVPSWQPRVLADGGDTAGSAILIDREHALTSVRVLPDPHREVTLVFDGSGTGWPARFAAARPVRVRPLDRRIGGGGLVVLKLAESAPGRAVLPALRGGAVGDRVAVYAGPGTGGAGTGAGRWLPGRILGDDGDWVRIGIGAGELPASGAGDAIGAGVVDIDTGAVVGMLVDGRDRTAFMLPVEVLSRYWPPVAAAWLASALGDRAAEAHQQLVGLLDDLLPRHWLQAIYRDPDPVQDLYRILVVLARLGRAHGPVEMVLSYGDGSLPADHLIAALERDRWRGVAFLLDGGPGRLGPWLTGPPAPQPIPPPAPAGDEPPLPIDPGHVYERHAGVSEEDLDEVDSVMEEDADEFVRGHVGGRQEWGERSRPPGPEPERYLVGELPSRVRVGAELSLIVSITTESPEPDLVAAALRGLSPGPQGTQVTLVVRPSAGLLALGELQQTVTVPQHGDCPPVRFAFRARAVGLSHIRVTSWLGGTFLAELRLEVSVESDEPVADSQRRSASIGGLRADPGEVTLQVRCDGARYSFQLLSHRYLFGPVVAESLTEEPGEAVERTVAMLRKMAGEVSGYAPALAARWVRETGTGLWQDLVPKSIQDQFWQLRGSITSFTIACEDDTMPWELLYPLTRSDDEGFLVEQFPVLRRVYDQGRSHRVLLGDARYVVPPGSPDNAQDEVAAIRRVLGQHGGSTIADLADLLDLLDAGSAGLLHFACHNTFSLEAGGSSIKMAGGPFVPQLLNSAVARRRLAARSPLIFVNACRSAGVSAEYTRMMGWAGQFMAAGAGAFVGTLWPVRSSRASLFAEAFYAALVAGHDLGQASLAARRATKDDADPTWLAYTTYGDPAALGATQLSD